MRIICFLSILLTLGLNAAGQTIKEMTPELGKLIDKSPEGELAFIKQRNECEQLWAKLQGEVDPQKLSAADRKIYQRCAEMGEEEGYWDVLGPGCSWYCGGGDDTTTASSCLKSVKVLQYSSRSLHDFSYRTAWVEGVPGYGIGEYVVCHFPPQNPRITQIIIVNGYVKSEQAWKDNSRVKKLKLYINDKPVAILNLADSQREQYFKFDPIGYGDRANFDKLIARPWWTMKFEIMDVYKGDKYDDTAITEIYFDGIDVH